MTVEHTVSEMEQTVSARQGRFVSWLLYVLVYLTVLNLFVEYWDRVMIDSFTISVVTAALLAVLFKATLAIESRISGYFKTRKGAGALVLRILAVWGLLLGSKFIILEVVDIVFGEHVELGGILPFIVLAVSLIAAELIITRIHQSLADGK